MRLVLKSQTPEPKTLLPKGMGHNTEPFSAWGQLETQGWCLPHLNFLSILSISP